MMAGYQQGTVCPRCGANLDVWGELGLGEHNHY